jgi:predicted lactoylglutathione lyase
MTKEIWLNLPVKDIEKSTAFFTKIGFKLNQNAPNNNSMSSFAIGDKNFIVNFFREDIFKSFTAHEISDTEKGCEFLISIDAESEQEVDAILQKAVDAGGKIYAKGGYKDGWMYGGGFIDLDGHRWNLLHMDMSKMPK